MKILLITTSHNSMSQRIYVELKDHNHEVDIHITSTNENMIEAVNQSMPDLIICPFLKAAIPNEIWENHVCVIVHPGIKGDRGASSLDWAILNKNTEWGTTLLQAEEEMDAGDIWSSNNYPMREATKSALYRNEATTAAVKGLFDLLEKYDQFLAGDYKPEPLNYDNSDVKGTLLPNMKQADRKIDWSNDDTETIARKIRSADSNPGVLDSIEGEKYYLFGCHVEDTIKGEIKQILGYRDDAVLLGTKDGAVWISHVKKKGDIKLPSTIALKHLLTNVPDLSISPFDEVKGRTYREIYYTEENEVGYLHFDFYNGAMHTEHCKKLKDAIVEARKKDTTVLVLMGGEDFWSNGIHLNTIQNAESPADESWDNINAIDDVVLEIINTTDKLVITAMQGNAGAGGVILGLAADIVYARDGVVLNPHYKKMGNLYGSEYWTYLLPRRVGTEKALELTETCPALSTYEAKEIGLIDRVLSGTSDEFMQQIVEAAEYQAQIISKDVLTEVKTKNREEDEKEKPLAKYREEELEQMKINFYGDDNSYHKARREFVLKVSCETKSILFNPNRQVENKLEGSFVTST